MKTVRVKGYAKVNMFLDIVGESDGFHMLDTIVSSINLYDIVTATTRKDNKIVVRTSGGLYSIANIDERNNNAYKTAELFQKTFNTCGVDITIKKNIPIACGLGGSSADISATLTALKMLYNVDGDLKPLADKLGSDSGYMLTGGFARLTGKGEIVEPLDIDKEFYLLVLPVKGGVNTKECYKAYDTLKKPPIAGGSDRLIANLKQGIIKQEDFYNALYEPAITLNDNVRVAYERLKSLSPNATLMSGSGSGVYCIFDTEELCAWALEKVKYDYPKAFITRTVKEPYKEQFLKSIYSL